MPDNAHRDGKIRAAAPLRFIFKLTRAAELHGAAVCFGEIAAALRMMSSSWRLETGAFRLNQAHAHHRFYPGRGNPACLGLHGIAQLMMRSSHAAS